MPRRAEWTRLVPGLIMLAALVLGAAAVLIFARVGALHGRRVRLYALTGQARGVLRGTEVWLAGQKVGLVRDIVFRPVSTDTAQRLVVAFEVLEKYRRQIRRDSYMQIRTGGSLIGAPVVYLTIGSPRAAEVRDRDTLAAKPQGDAEGVTTQFGQATAEFPIIVGNLRALGMALDSAAGTAGAALRDHGALRRLGAVRTRVGTLARRATTGRGTMGLALRGGDGALVDRARQAVAEVDSLRALLQSNQTTLGRFRRDSTLARTVADVKNDVSIVRTLLAEPRGTAGRAVADSAIVRQLGEVEHELDLLVKDIKRRPLRYLTL